MFIITPEWTTANSVLYVLLGLLALAIGPLIYRLDPQATRQTMQRKTIPTRVAMLCLYGSPIIVVLIIASPVWMSLNLVQALVLGALLGHFSKRCLEALFVHKYSASTALATTIPIAIFYATVAGMGSQLALQIHPAPDFLFWLGSFLFTLGEIGNFIHHKRLADLRKDSRSYVVPRGGLFEYVACPHYLFEIIAWLGMVFMSRHLFMLIAWIGMIGFLTARAQLAHKWYRAEFPDYPKTRKALVPFVL